MTTDLFGAPISDTIVKPTRAPIVRTEEERKKLSETRFAAEFSMTSLFAELEVQEPEEDDDESEGKANPELDAMLRISNADISHCTDAQLEYFVREVHSAALEVNLDYLQSEDCKPRVLKEKGYILQWIFCDDIVHGVPQSRIVCSFLNCCIAYGCDPDALRSKLLQMPLIRDLMVRLHLIEEKRLPPLRSNPQYIDIVGADHPSLPGHPVFIAGV